MKSKFLTLTLTILVGVACQKETPQPIKQKVPIVTTGSESFQKANATGLMLWELFDTGGPHGSYSYFTCAGSPGGCGTEVSVSGITNSDILDNIYLAIETNNNSKVATLFSTHETELMEVFSEKIITDVMEGSLTLEKGSGKIGDPAIYLLFKNQEGAIEFAQPIIH